MRRTRHKTSAVADTEDFIKALEKDKKSNNDLQELHLELNKSHREQQQLIEEHLAKEKRSNNELQKLQSELKKGDNMQQELIEALLVKDEMRNNQLQKLESELKKNHDDMQELRSQLITQEQILSDVGDQDESEEEEAEEGDGKPTDTEWASPSEEQSEDEEVGERKSKLDKRKHQVSSRVSTQVTSKNFVGFKCYFEELISYVNDIVSKFDKRTIEILMQTPFGQFFDMILKKTITKRMVESCPYSIIDIIGMYTGEGNGFMFKDNAEVVNLEAEEVSLMFGIPLRGETFDTSDKGKQTIGEFETRYFKKGKRITKKELRKEMQTILMKKSKTEQDRIDIVKMLLLYSFATFFFGTTNGGVAKKFLKKFESLTYVNNCSWPRLIHTFLMKSIKTYYKKPTSVSGCVYVLLYFLVEHVDLLKPIKGCEQSSPMMLKWNLSKLTGDNWPEAYSRLENTKIVRGSRKVPKINEVDVTEVFTKPLLEMDKKSNNDLQDLHLEVNKSHNEQEQLIEELLAMEKTSNNELQKLQSEPKKSNNKRQKLESELKKSHDDDLQELRSQLITGLNEMSGFDTIGVKNLGEVDAKPFQEFCKQKFPDGEVNEMSAKLCSFFQEYLKKGKTTKEDYDQMVGWIKGSFSDGIYDAVKKALMEMNEYNPVEREIVPELWNFAENRKAALKECVTAILNKLKANGC